MKDSDTFTFDLSVSQLEFVRRILGAYRQTFEIRGISTSKATDALDALHPDSAVKFRASKARSEMVPEKDRDFVEYKWHGSRCCDEIQWRRKGDPGWKCLRCGTLSVDQANSGRDKQVS